MDFKLFYSKRLSKFSEISHSFFNKNGGVSKGIYKSLNCGFGSKDKKGNINFNLKIVKRKISVYNNSFYLAVLYCFIFALSPIYAPRYFFPVYILLAIVLSMRKQTNLYGKDTVVRA